MENRKLPNATTSIVLGIISFIACCFSAGIGGIILSWIALFLANKDSKRYAADPDGYDNYSQVKTAKIIAIIGLILAIISLIWGVITIISMGGISGYIEHIKSLVEQSQAAQK